MTSISDTIRLALHIGAASIWLGGQLVLASIVPAVARENRAVLPVIAKQFARIAWPAFAVLVLTGMWSLMTMDISATDGRTQVAVFVKIIVGVMSGVAAAVHAVGTSRLAKAVGGAVGLLAAMVALVLGILIRTGG